MNDNERVKDPLQNKNNHLNNSLSSVSLNTEPVYINFGC